MGRPQESFNKHENEQKRAKRKEEKERKKEERKANAGKSKSLDDMIMYIDEDGNFSSTPPDPNRKKKEINQEDIKISVSRQEDTEPVDVRRKGTVTFFNESKGYGFIKDTDTQESIFVHINALPAGPLKERDKVTFEVEQGPKGLMAVRVKLG